MIYFRVNTWSGMPEFKLNQYSNTKFYHLLIHIDCRYIHAGTCHMDDKSKEKQSVSVKCGYSEVLAFRTASMPPVLDSSSLRNSNTFRVPLM